MKKNIIIGSVVIILFLMTIFIVYKSNALYKTSDTHNFINSKINMFLTKDFAYTGNSQEFIAPQSGYYKIELWGASGADFGGYTGGKGGYTSGIINLSKGEKIYWYIGGKANNSTGGYNGGGNSRISIQYGEAGGGATDVRLISGAWNDSTSLRSRIMVAGAGGGAENRGDGYGAGNGGAGGNLIGENGRYEKAGLKPYGQYPGEGGSQIKGGKVLEYNNVAGIVNHLNPKLFGVFGNTGSEFLHGGAGSGYYGGGASAHGGAGGGSSYISGYAGVNSVLETGGTAAQPNHTNNTIHYSNKYFINGKMQAGINSGNGKAKITYLNNNQPSRTNTKLNNVRFIKDCSNQNTISIYSHWIEISAIKDGVNVALNIPLSQIFPTSAAFDSNRTYNYVVDGKIDNIFGNTEYGSSSTGGMQCITIDLGKTYNLDEIAIWKYYVDNRTYYNNTTSVGTTNTSTTTPLNVKLMDNQNLLATSSGTRYTAWD